MYEINLIHDKIVPIGKQRTRMGLLLGYGLLWAITITVYVYYFDTTESEIESSTAAKRLVESRNALPSGVTSDDVTALARQLEATREALLMMGNQRFNWSAKLARIHHFLPDDTWLDEISCRESTAHFKAARDGNPPEPLTEFVIQGTVLLPEGASGAESLNRYITGLQGDKDFMAKVKEMNHLVLGRERYGSREIAKFMIVCVIEEGVRLDG